MGNVVERKRGGPRDEVYCATSLSADRKVATEASPPLAAPFVDQADPHVAIAEFLLPSSNDRRIGSDVQSNAGRVVV